MKKFSLVVMVSLALPSAATATTLEKQGSNLREKVVKKFGKRAPGRDIVRWGVKTNNDTRKAKHSELEHYIGVLKRMLTPPPTPVVQQHLSAPVSTTRTVAAPAASGSSGSLPSCTWVPESGGNWRAVNPSSGAGGRYQILPSTWLANGGTGLPQNASPAEQTRVAQNVLHSQGIHAWVNC